MWIARVAIARLTIARAAIARVGISRAGNGQATGTTSDRVVPPLSSSPCRVVLFGFEHPPPPGRRCSAPPSGTSSDDDLECVGRGDQAACLGASPSAKVPSRARRIPEKSEISRLSRASVLGPPSVGPGRAAPGGSRFQSRKALVFEVASPQEASDLLQGRSPLE